MTLPQLIANLFCCFLLLAGVSGQQTDVSQQVLVPAAEQLVMTDSLDADSTGGALAVPIAFSPNGDPYNPYFEVETDGTTVYEFNVFTRTGTRVYRSESPRIFWDGKSNGGVDLKEGVYYYVIEEIAEDDPYTRAGFVYLFR